MDVGANPGGTYGEAALACMDGLWRRCEDDRNPTVAYAWDVVRVYTGESKALYKVFSNELDALTPFQV